MTTRTDRELAAGDSDETNPQAPRERAPGANAATGDSVCSAHCWYHPDQAPVAPLGGVAVLLYDRADRNALIVDLLDQPATYRFATIRLPQTDASAAGPGPELGVGIDPDTATALLADGGVAGDMESHTQVRISCRPTGRRRVRIGLHLGRARRVPATADVALNATRQAVGQFVHHRRHTARPRLLAEP